jgi:hypothetical protein
MRQPQHVARGLIVLVLLVAGTTQPAGRLALRANARPETVMVTLHAKRGGETELAAVLARHWETARRLDLVEDAPHVTLRGVESEQTTYFVEIFTWRDASIPDNAPAAIRTIWADMNRLVESRHGERGLRLTEVSILAAGR